MKRFSPSKACLASRWYAMVLVAIFAPLFIPAEDGTACI